MPHSATAEGIHAAGHMSCWLVQASLTSDLYTAASQLFEFSAARSPEHSPSRAPISTATHTANHNPPVPTDATGSSSRSRQMLIWPCSLIRIFMLCHMHVSYYKDRRREAGTPTLGHAGLSMSQHVSACLMHLCTCVRRSTRAQSPIVSPRDDGIRMAPAETHRMRPDHHIRPNSAATALQCWASLGAYALSPGRGHAPACIRLHKRHEDNGRVSS